MRLIYVGVRGQGFRSPRPSYQPVILYNMSRETSPHEPATVEDIETVRNEEYKIWKKQSPFLYDVCVSKAMLSPSASVQWYPSTAPYKTDSRASAAFSAYSLLLTSSELVGGPNAVYRAQCELPDEDATAAMISQRKASEEPIKVVDGVHNMDLGAGNYAFKARFSQLNPSLVAASCREGVLKYYKNDAFVADLAFHKKDVFDISWSPHQEALLASVSADGTAAVWDTASASLKHSFAGSNAVGMAESIPAPINAVQFAPLNANELATAGDDRVINFWDLRSSLEKPTRAITDAHGMGVTTLEYSPHNEMLLATGSADGSVSLWDVRMSSASLLGLNVEAGQVNALKWSPSEESVFASGGVDSQVKVWDLSRNHQPETAGEEEEGPPELMFIHGGHMASISDIAWHPTLPWTICSVSEDSLVDIWKISSAIVNVEPEEEENEEE